MCTVIKRIGPSLAYLEQIRQHMTRLPSIDPNTRIILICGYPIVGKSSFMNKITRANVDVQPYAFTAKSLFVGHMDYKYLGYQVIDTPGILDRPFKDRNKRFSITALARLRAAVLFFLDVSGSCGRSVWSHGHDYCHDYWLNQNSVHKKNTEVDHNIQSLWTRPYYALLLFRPLDGISEEDKKLVMEIKAEAMKTLIGQGGEWVLLIMSTLIEDGVIGVKNAACEGLLIQRKKRPLCIPQAVLEAKAKQVVEKIEKDLEDENGGTRVYSASLSKNCVLENNEWKEDIMTKIVDALAEIRKKKSLLIQQHRLKKSTGESRPFIPRKFDTGRKFTTERMSNQLSCLRLDLPLAINRASSKSRCQKRER
ncbi:hypothetical protein Gohar_027596 [Gossypium harknessii]|uniref:OBG-type G domain-containing protein n=1 Tax=Gossypium harknessii TaxID=34285 RepID=A0A7J9HWP8_9ROSI|nr:hypothetical protein [Gossypium harknessii]